MKSPLPIDSLLPECAKLLESHSQLILQATPGSGKTTRLPPFLLRSKLFGRDSQIWVLQPRRLAAKFAAARVAQEENVTLGEWVGYHFRFEKKFSPQTRLLYLTEGMLMRRLLNDSTLQSVSAVILDEFHERHIHTDIALSFLRHLQATTRPDLKIIVMSATLDLEQLKSFLPDAAIKQLETPNFPVEIKYLPQEKTSRPLRSLVGEVIKERCLRSEPGDILIFLPGIREIRDCESELGPLSRRFQFSLFTLHGEIAKELQEKALQPHERRKVILSTNIAETSLTIPGINCVIDSGLQRTASYSWWTGVPLLSTKATPKSSSIQRAGRAGRTEPGICYRLYTQHEFETRPTFDIPEIRRADLAQTVLELKALGIPHLSRFSWYEPPPGSSLQSSQKLLFQLGALESTGDNSRLTPIGEKMKDSSLHPRLSRFLLACEKLYCLKEGIHMAALISNGKLESLEALEDLHRPLDSQTEQLKRQIEKDFKLNQVLNSPLTQDKKDALGRSFLLAFCDRIAQARISQKTHTGQRGYALEFILAAGGTAYLPPDKSFTLEDNEPFYIAIDIQEFKRNQNSSLHVRSLIPVRLDWIYEMEPSPLEELEFVEWSKEKLVSFSQIKVGQIVLDSQERPLNDELLAFNAIVKDIFKTTPEKLETNSLYDWVELFKVILPEGEMESTLVRLGLIKKFLDKGKELTSSNLVAFLKSWTFEKRTRREISHPSCIEAAIQYFLEDSQHILERNVPSFLILPNQRRAKIQYQIDKGPWVESRMQDFFGLTQAPTLCDGRVPLTLHLLAPNFRAVQVTSDLKNFWDSHYPSIRKELSRNYPRHAWPENPRIPLPPTKKHRN